MLLALLAIVIGLCLITWSASRFVDGAASIAHRLGMSPMLVGLTIVAFGTSAPEILISGVAAWQSAPALAVGNAVGSNIANIALVLGLTALIVPLYSQRSNIQLELNILLGATILAGILLADQYLGRLDGILLFTGLIICLYLFKRSQKNALQSNTEIVSMGCLRSLFRLVTGLTLLMLSSRLLVWGAIDIAVRLGVSELIIGLTVVAIGTSIPELATSIVSALRNQPDMAIGNVVGSNIFNLLAVMSLPGLIQPSTISTTSLWRDYGLMLLLTVALIANFRIRNGNSINRPTGGLLLLVYVGYLVLLYTNVN
jgi:cation:H+ antiporter